MRIDSEVAHGIFCHEIKNRFRAMVLVEGEPVVCYVASSCRLSNLMRLDNREVLLIPSGENSNRTEYTVFAVKHRNSFTLVDLSMANAIIAEQLHRRIFSFLGSRRRWFREKTISDYKTDIFIEDTNTIVEIKTIISEKKEAVFPSVYSRRSIGQLDKIEELLKHGFRVCFILASLCPATQIIRIDEKTELGERLDRCLKLGLMLRAFRIKTKKNEVYISGCVRVE